MIDPDSRYDEAQSQYNSLLDTYENHSTIDYFLYLLKDKNMLNKKISENSLSTKQIYRYVIFYYLLRCIFLFILVLIPFLVPYVVKAIEYWINNIC